MQEGTEGLTGRALDVGVNGILGQPGLAIALADLIRQRSAHRSIGIDNVALDPAGQTLLERQLSLSD